MTSEIITIDGPASSGKGTIARALANYLGWQYLDSGALYRVSALAAVKNKVGAADVAALSRLAQDLKIQFSDTEVYLDGEKVTDAIRTERIGLLASQIAALPEVRAALLEKQRSFARAGNLVADGRDMGTVVFPEARLKIFLTASAEERARRRTEQLGFRLNSPEYEEILEAIQARDAQDSERKEAPLVRAKDARPLDSTGLTIAETLKKIISWYHELNK